MNLNSINLINHNIFPQPITENVFLLEKPLKDTCTPTNNQQADTKLHTQKYKKKTRHDLLKTFKRIQKPKKCEQRNKKNLKKK